MTLQKVNTSGYHKPLLIMKNLKSFYLLTFLFIGLVIIPSCKDDDGDSENNMITITIDEPMNEESIAMANCGDVHIHIDIEASVENHEIEIILHPEGDVNDKIIDKDMHDHDKVINFEQEVDLCSYAAGTCFHLEVAACIDHDCETKERADVEFCLQ